jgi:hypothetical protein
MDKKLLDKSASRLLGVLDRHTEGLSVAERDAKWKALAEVVAKVETRAKRQELPKTQASPRPDRKRV